MLYELRFTVEGDVAMSAALDAVMGLNALRGEIRCEAAGLERSGPAASSQLNENEVSVMERDPGGKPPPSQEVLHSARRLAEIDARIWADEADVLDKAQWPDFGRRARSISRALRRLGEDMRAREA